MYMQFAHVLWSCYWIYVFTVLGRQIQYCSLGQSEIDILYFQTFQKAGSKKNSVLILQNSAQSVSPCLFALAFLLLFKRISAWLCTAIISHLAHMYIRFGTVSTNWKEGHQYFRLHFLSNKDPPAKQISFGSSLFRTKWGTLKSRTKWPI